MPIVYRGDGAWGAGLGTNLTAAQVDNNFWEVVLRLVGLETREVAVNVLTLTGNAVANETVTIGTRTYTWKAVVGAVANEVEIGASASASLDNLIAAINGDAGAGIIYGTGTVPHPIVTAVAGAGDTMDVEAKVAGEFGNTIVAAETMTAGSWATTPFFAGGIGIGPDSIESISVIGSQMTIFMQSGDTFGPFTIPIAMIKWRGDFAPLVDYAELDLILVPKTEEFPGVYLVRVAHESEDPFDPARAIDSVNVYHKLFAISGEGQIVFRGDYVDGETYLINDLLIDPPTGGYIVLQDHTTAGAFNPALLTGGLPTYARLSPALDSDEIVNVSSVAGATVSDALDTLEALIAGGGVTLDFIDLDDAPSSYAGHANKLIAVKAAEDGVEFVSTVGRAIQFPDGTAALPAVAVGEVDSGLYQTADGELNISTNATFRASFSSTGFYVAPGGTYALASHMIHTLLGTASVWNQESNATSFIRASNFDNSASSASAFETYRSRGTRAAPIAVAQGSVLGRFRMVANSDTVPTWTSVYEIRGEMRAATPSGTDLETRAYEFLVPAASVTLTEFLRKDHATGLSMFGANPVIDQLRHHVLRSYTVAGAPAAASHTNKLITLSDASGGPILAHSDGTIWQTPVLSNKTSNLTVGHTATAFNAGSKSGAVTYKPAPADGNLQRATNDGAHTFAAPDAAGDYTIVVQYTNGAAAGTITISGFSKQTGDALTTTNGHDFMMYITKINGFTHLNVVALQ